MPTKIITSFDYPPIPVRDLDWSAHRDGDEPNDDGQMKMGHGPTESAAILDLHESLCDEREECPCDRDKAIDPHCCAAGMCVREGS